MKCDLCVPEDVLDIQLKRQALLKETCKSQRVANLNYSQIFQHSEKFYFADDTHKLLALPVPKAGCTSWKMTLLNNSQLAGAHLANRSVHNKAIFREHGFRIFQELQLKEKAKIFDSYFKIVGVRHPFDRLESAYMDKVLDYKSDPGCKRTIVQFLKGKANYAKEDIQSNVTFEDFLTGVMGVQNRHWTNYVELALPCDANLRNL